MSLIKGGSKTTKDNKIMSNANNKIIKTEKTEEKRPPGRPPGKKIKNKQKKLGIVSQPDAAPKNMGEVIFQMMYHDPISFKSIFNTFKKYHTSVIEF